MPSFGRRSLDVIESCCFEIQAVCHSVIKVYDFTAICGLRNMEDQNKAFDEGRSNLEWPNSKHNVATEDGDEDPDGLSSAIDIAPWFHQRPHIRWDQERSFIFLAGHMMQAAAELDIKLRWGGNWDQDQDLYDRNVPFDLVHFEVIK